MYCSNCGNQLRETDIFCSKCGHKQRDENKVKELPQEEVVFNTSSQREKEDSFPKQENSKDRYEREQESFAQAPRQAQQSANSSRGTVEDGFIWNVHQFPEPGPRETEDINFRWDEEVRPQPQRSAGTLVPQEEKFSNEGKFHTYNKSREEFQELLDKEYLRQNPEYEDLLDEKGKRFPEFDPIDHIKNMEKQREEMPGYYSELDYDDKENQKFDTVELQKDLFQPQMDEASKTQIIEKIKYGDEVYKDQVDDFDIKKTQFVQKLDLEIEKPLVIPVFPSNAPSIPTMDDMRYSDDYIDLNSGKEVENNDGGSTEKILAPNVESDPTPNATPNMGEQLAKLWDSETAPIPVVSLASEIAADKKHFEEVQLESYDPANDPEDGGEDYEEKHKRKGGFLGKLVISIIVIVLIIEGSILGLRNFAPESDVTLKANEVILVLQNWIEDTFFNENKPSE